MLSHLPCRPVLPNYVIIAIISIHILSICLNRLTLSRSHNPDHRFLMFPPAMNPTFQIGLVATDGVDVAQLTQGLASLYGWRAVTMDDAQILDTPVDEDLFSPFHLLFNLAYTLSSPLPSCMQFVSCASFTNAPRTRTHMLLVVHSVSLHYSRGFSDCHCSV
jgi:hypothetical protein